MIAIGKNTIIQNINHNKLPCFFSLAMISPSLFSFIENMLRDQYYFLTRVYNYYHVEVIKFQSNKLHNHHNCGFGLPV